MNGQVHEARGNGGGGNITNIGMLFTGFPIQWVNDLELHVCDLRYISRCCNKP